MTVEPNQTGAPTETGSDAATAADALDSEGGEILKKQFGISGEKDILSELIIGSENLYMVGQLTGTNYQTNSNLGMFLYITKSDFSEQATC